jgi:hypothetical protein
MLFIYWTWCLPQTLIGFIIYQFYRTIKKVVKVKNYKAAKIIFIRTKLFSGVSFGKYIILQDSYMQNETTIKHEYGHTKQSFILGPFYLILVGIPSICRNIIWRIRKLSNDDYYKGYPEDWADRLGGVQRHDI